MSTSYWKTVGESVAKGLGEKTICLRKKGDGSVRAANCSDARVSLSVSD